MKKKNVTKANFELTKFKFKDGKVAIDYQVNIPDEGITRKQNFSFVEEMHPHPDLTDELAKMKRMLAYQLGQTQLEAVVNSPQFNASKEQKKYVEAAVEKMMEDVKVSGFSLSGDENSKVKITGSFRGIGLAGKLFSLDGESQGFEEDARAVIDFVSDEAYEYIFNMKRAQLSAFSGDDQEDEEEKEPESKGEA